MADQFYQENELQKQLHVVGPTPEEEIEVDAV